MTRLVALQHLQREGPGCGAGRAEKNRPFQPLLWFTYSQRVVVWSSTSSTRKGPATLGGAAIGVGA